MTSRIIIGAVGKKREGLSANRKPWTLWQITAESGLEFTTFDGALADRAFRNVGAGAEIEFEFTGHGDRKLTGLTIEAAAA